MIKAILFDLDDTLLGNSMDGFMRRYFGLLGAYARPILDEKTFLAYLLQSTQAVIRNDDPASTNADVFWANFEQLSGLRRADLEPFFARFYETEFGRLRELTQARPEAVELVRESFDRGLQVVIATNPLFPRTAIEQRLEWAGVPASDYPYALVTTYETMHAAKPRPAYYREILSVIGRAPDEALMVGDDWDNDVVPAAATGLYAYWINETDESPDPALIRGRGTLAALLRELARGLLLQPATDGVAP